MHILGIDVGGSGIKEAGIVGAALTPFLLSRIAEITAGRSLAANRALLENNAAVAAGIAVALAEEE